MPPRMESYDAVTQFLTGELNLAEFSVLRSVPHAARALVALAVVLAEPDEFLCKPHKDMVLNYPLEDFYTDLYGSTSKGAIAQASRKNGFHITGTGSNQKRIELHIPAELRVLAEQHKDSQALREATYWVGVKRIQRQGLEEARAKALTTSAAKVTTMAAHLTATYEPSELIELIRLLRADLQAPHWDRYTDPNYPYHHSERLHRAVTRQSK